jgi:hypothetical protein
VRGASIRRVLDAVLHSQVATGNLAGLGRGVLSDVLRAGSLKVDLFNPHNAVVVTIETEEIPSCGGISAIRAGYDVALLNSLRFTS